MRGNMVVGVLSIAFAFGALPLSAQIMTAPGGEAGGPAAAPPMGENAEEAPARILPIGRPHKNCRQQAPVNQTRQQL